MTLEKALSGPAEVAELRIREIIAAPYLDRQEELHERTGERYYDDANALETFNRIQSGIRSLYAEPAGKLALSKNLWQYSAVEPDTGEVAWKFRHPEEGKRLANRIEGALAPTGEPILPGIQNAAQNEIAGNISPSQQKSKFTWVVKGLQKIWKHYGSLEEEHRAAETPLPFTEYILESRRSRFPEIWYKGWLVEEQHTLVTYVPGAEIAQTNVDTQGQEPEPEAQAQRHHPDLAVITQAITRLPESVADVMRCFLTARQNHLSHAEFSELLGTNTREATMRLTAAYQEATNWLEAAEYAALTAMRYL